MKKILPILLVVLSITICLGQVTGTTDTLAKATTTTFFSLKWLLEIFNPTVTEIAGFLIVGVSGWFYRKIILTRVLTPLFRYFKKNDIEHIYKNKAESENDLKSELSKATKVCIYTSRGNELNSEIFKSLLADKQKDRVIEMKVLLPKTEHINGEINWVEIRQTENDSFDSAYNAPNRLKGEFESNFEYLKTYKKSGVSVKRYSYPHIGRIIITDNFVFYSPYSKTSHRSLNPVFKYRKGAMYDNYCRMFNLLWENITTGG